MTRNSEDSERVQDEGRTLKFGDVEVLDEIRDGEGKYRRFTWSEGVEDVWDYRTPWPGDEVSVVETWYSTINDITPRTQTHWGVKRLFKELLVVIRNFWFVEWRFMSCSQVFRSDLYIYTSNSDPVVHTLSLWPYLSVLHQLLFRNPLRERGRTRVRWVNILLL